MTDRRKFLIDTDTAFGLLKARLRED